MDPCSLGNASSLSTRHLHLELSADFVGKTLRGYALHTATAKTDGVAQFVLDTRGLVVARCMALLEGGQETALQWTLTPSEVQAFGSALTVQLPSTLRAGEEVNIKVYYETSPSADAIQWLEPQQTRGKTHPYLFTQCQAIHARSLYPCQDAPGAKFTYSAEITVPSSLNVVMSAIKTSKQPKLSQDGKFATHSFVQKVNIPSYLLAIAVGNLTCKTFGKNSRCSVWSEPEMVGIEFFNFLFTLVLSRLKNVLMNLDPILMTLYPSLKRFVESTYGENMDY
jgi:leukotriene-A4 hydrolase